jgi:hypothetical protein
MKKKGEHYVDNIRLYDEMVEYKKMVKLHKNGEIDKPIVSDYICESIMRISDRLSYRPNFINYTYRDEMVSDGVENCLLYINNFDPSKSKNPFSYFTQIIYFAFIRRIQKEKKQLYVKYKSIYNSNVFDNDDMRDADINSIKDSYLGFVMENRENIDIFLDDFERVQDEKRALRVKNKVSNSIQEETVDENCIDN